MSAKARSLLKKLRAKKLEEEGDQTPEKKENEPNKESTSNNPFEILKNQSKNSHSVPKDIKVKQEPFIDPLDYFKTEHIIIKESNMDEYTPEGIKKELEEEKNKDKEKEATKKIGGMIGVRGFKVNFEEMMKARAKVKKEPQQEKKSLSVGARNVKSNQNKYEYVKKNKANKEDNLYIKLVLAKNKFNAGKNQHLYTEIMKRIDELKGYKDLSEDLTKELNDIINELKIKNNLVLCSDVQVVSDDEDGTDSIGKQISLDQIINKMGIRGDM